MVVPHTIVDLSAGMSTPQELARHTLTVHDMRDGRAACARTRTATESYASKYLRPWALKEPTAD